MWTLKHIELYVFKISLTFFIPRTVMWQAPFVGIELIFVEQAKEIRKSQDNERFKLKVRWISCAEEATKNDKDVFKKIFWRTLSRLCRKTLQDWSHNALSFTAASRPNRGRHIFYLFLPLDVMLSSEIISFSNKANGASLMYCTLLSFSLAFSHSTYGDVLWVMT